MRANNKTVSRQSFLTGYHLVKGHRSRQHELKRESAKFDMIFVFFFQGFEDVIRAHFRLQREEILKQCAEWLTQCADEEEETRMRKAIDCLKAELDKL